jgi:hypothetical protein
MKRYWKRDRVKDLTQKELHKLIYFMYDFCVENLGVNNRKRTKLSCTLEKEKSGNYGWYDPQTNEVIVSLYNCKTIGHICSTFIHEYTHSLQPCLTKYNKLLSEHGYVNHPFEIESKHNEKIYTNQSLKEFRKTL